MRESKNSNKGFSLVEMLVAISLLTIVVASLTQVLISASKVNQKSKRTMSATEMAQNMFEGINSKTPEDAIVELSSLAYSSDVILDEPMSIIPDGMSYDDLGEYKYVTDPSTGAVVYKADASTGGDAVRSIASDLSSGTLKYRCKGFKENSDGKYTFWIQGLKQMETYYDVRITFDASQYDTTYAPASADPLYKTDYVSIPTISDVNSSYDGMFLETTLGLSNVISGEYDGKQIGIALSEADILKNLERTYTLDIKDVGVSGSPQIVVDLTQNYFYTQSSDLAIGYTGAYTSSVERIFDSSTSGNLPRNLYIYYTPNYNSTSQGIAALDQFVVNNLSDYDVNVYIVRMQQSGSDAIALGNVTTTTTEEAYAATIQINESDVSVDKVDTTICTNLDEDILKTSTVSDYKNRERVMSKITYNLNTLTPDESKNRIEIKSLDAQQEEKRVYDVTVEVYMGKAGGKGDNNGNSSYTGAYANDFPDAAKLATFTGSIVQ